MDRGSTHHKSCRSAVTLKKLARVSRPHKGVNTYNIIKWKGLFGIPKFKRYSFSMASTLAISAYIIKPKLLNYTKNYIRLTICYDYVATSLDVHKSG